MGERVVMVPWRDLPRELQSRMIGDTQAPGIRVPPCFTRVPSDYDPARPDRPADGGARRSHATGVKAAAAAPRAAPAPAPAPADAHRRN